MEAAVVAMCQGEVVAYGEVGWVPEGPDQVQLGGYVAGTVSGGKAGAPFDCVCRPGPHLARGPSGEALAVIRGSGIKPSRVLGVTVAQHDSPEVTGFL